MKLDKYSYNENYNGKTIGNNGKQKFKLFNTLSTISKFIPKIIQSENQNNRDDD